MANSPLLLLLHSETKRTIATLLERGPTLSHRRLTPLIAEGRIPRHRDRHRHPRRYPREYRREDVAVGVVEYGLHPTRAPASAGAWTIT